MAWCWVTNKRRNEVAYLHRRIRSDGTANPIARSQKVDERHVLILGSHPVSVLGVNGHGRGSS